MWLSFSWIANVVILYGFHQTCNKLYSLNAISVTFILMHQISSKKKDQYESTIPELKREEEQKFAQRSATRRRRK